MSGTTNISVTASGQVGGFILPSDFAGSPTVPGNINSSIASLIANYVASASGSTQFFENRDIVTTPASDYLVNGTDATGLQVFSNTNNDGTVATGSVTGGFSVTANNAATLLVVQAPGNETVTGSSSTTGAFFGANSNVNYSVVNPDAGSIFAAGGADSITLEQFGSSRLNESVASAGHDTVYAQGQGSVNVSAVGSASDYVTIGAANVTVSASDNAQAIIGFDGPNAGGSLYFINNSTAQQSIFAAVFGSGNTAATASVNVTAFGGIGGGYFIGGQKSGNLGENLLVAGAPGSFSVNAATGAIFQGTPDGNAGFTTLLGGSGGTVMDVQSRLGADVFLGTGSETVIAASTSGSNLFQIGLNYPGLGFVPSEGLVSSDGSGTQSFFVGNSVGATLVGSSAVGSNNNIFYITSDTVNGQAIGGGNFKIENFADNGYIFLENASESAPSSVSITSDGAEQGSPQNTQITLSDGTSITLLNTDYTRVHTIVGGNNVTTFYYS